MGNKHLAPRWFGYKKLSHADYESDNYEGHQKQLQQPLLLDVPDQNQFLDYQEMVKKNAQLDKRLKDMATTIDHLKSATASSLSNYKQDIANLAKKNADLEKKVIIMTSEIEKLKAASSNFINKEDVTKLMKNNDRVQEKKLKAASCNFIKKEDLTKLMKNNDRVQEKKLMDMSTTIIKSLKDASTYSHGVESSDDVVLPQPPSQSYETSDIFGCLILIIFLLSVLIGISLPI